MASPQELIIQIAANVEVIQSAVKDLTDRLTRLEQESSGIVPALVDIDTKLQALAGQLTPK